MSFDYEHHLLTNIPLIYTTNFTTNYNTNLNNTCILKPVRRRRVDVGETAIGAETTGTSVTAAERRRSRSRKKDGTNGIIRVCVNTYEILYHIINIYVCVLWQNLLNNMAHMYLSSS
jgi:hypothetical protein